MRVLFVSGTSVGGAARSTIELAEVLAARGHATAVLLRDDAATGAARRHKRLLNLRVKLERRGAPSPVVRLAERAHRVVGRRRHGARSVEAAVPVWLAPLPENALASARRALLPDVVVVNSIERPAWRQIRADLDRDGVPHVLYLREATGVRHLAEPPAPPRLLLANAEAHADAARALGFECAVVPSVVDTSRCVVTSSRERALLVNPIALYGVELALALADARPDIPFTFAESWPVPEAQRAALDAAVAARPNVELRAPRDDPRAVYADARLLLMLCTVASRPRVIAEAQANAIPVLAPDRPGHAEGIGAGGVLVEPTAPLRDWVSALSRMWDDPLEYERLCAAALDHAARADMAPETVAARFESLLEPLLAPARVAT